MQVFLEKSRMYAGLLRTIMYALIFFFWGKIKCFWVSLDGCWVLLDASRVCMRPCFWPETSFSLIFWKCYCHSFSTFVLRLVNYISFTLALCLAIVCEWLQSLRVVESYFCFYISFNSKIQKYFTFCIVMHFLHFASAWYLH